MLLTSLYEPEEQEAVQMWAHPLKNIPQEEICLRIMADMTVLFSCYKAEDDWEDEHSLKGLVQLSVGRKIP